MPTKYRSALMHLPFQIPVLKLTLQKALDPKNYPGLELHENDNGDSVLCKFNGDVIEIPKVNFHALVHFQEEPNKEVAVEPKAKAKK